MVQRVKSPLLVEDNKFCPGCGHGIINRLMAEVLDELGVADNTIGVAAVGCACLQIDTFGIDWIQAEHGRAPAVATGIKRCRPDKVVLSYQGDGDCLAIGMAETIHTAFRGENLTMLFVNNGVFGMTGGQMAPTTLPGQKTTTSVHGRDVSKTGNPANILELLGTFDTVKYLARGSVTDVASINRTKGYIRKAFENQLAGRGYSFVEVLSPCPTNWGLTPLKAIEHVKENVAKFYPTGEFVNRTEEAK
ncbi:thiamine pyrophosphate-dependent enzyme [Deltaproteobacteria bacterium OttesenSCG-928-K17]|nr:thiamine pyrophosphate-dependent enzyme [Deltaproteobacteria bacterium OttesenSCG-928-K17]